MSAYDCCFGAHNLRRKIFRHLYKYSVRVQVTIFTRRTTNGFQRTRHIRFYVIPLRRKPPDGELKFSKNRLVGEFAACQFRATFLFISFDNKKQRIYCCSIKRRTKQRARSPLVALPRMRKRFERKEEQVKQGSLNTRFSLYASGSVSSMLILSWASTVFSMR